MYDALHRLYRTKLAFLATIFTIVGIGLLIVGRLLPESGPLRWLAMLPLTDLGSALFTTGLVVVAFEYLDGKDNEERATLRLRQVLKEQAPAMRDAVIDGFAFDASDLKRVSSPDVLDQITRNSLAIQLGDQQFADELYADLKAQVLRAEERWYGLQVTIDLAPWDGAPSAAVSTPMFEATIRWEYTGVPSSSVRRFACVSDPKEYAELTQESASISAWRFTPVGGLTADSKDAFELVQFSVDGSDRPIRRTARASSQVYSVSLGKAFVDAREPVKIAYTYRTLVRQDGNLLFLTLSQPTKGVSIELRYGECSMDHLNILGFLGGTRWPAAKTASCAAQQCSARVVSDGWSLPQSGVAFVWSVTRQNVEAMARRTRTP